MPEAARGRQHAQHPWLAAAAPAAGCASPFHGCDIRPGTPREAVPARMGPPTRIVCLDEGGVVRRAHPGMEFVDAPERD